jgi:DNA-binding XRE family transcriptional regulator
MPKLRKPSREEINAYRKRLNERAEAGALRYPFAVTEIRKTIGLTQERFAEIVGLTRRQIAEIERNEANPTVETLNKIGKLFGFTVGFVKRTPQENEPPSPFPK